MFTSRRSILALALSLVCVPALAGSLPDISKLTKGQSTYQQTVDSFGRPANIRRFADGRLTAFYVYNAPDPAERKHGGFFHSLAKRAKGTVKSVARQAIYRHTAGLGVAAGMVDSVAAQAADSVIDHVGDAAQKSQQAVTGMDNGRFCVLQFDARQVFHGGYCAAQR